METMEMINIINQNRNRVYKLNQQKSAQKKARKQMISNVFAMAGYLIATIAFVQVVTFIAKNYLQ